ncbi:hypothetical protein RFN28_24740 [Mesorhizobium sp. VK24D]|uniref:Uncharacterized protein n=1 Tax=Mesorhizobium album TaxID=3072314 RepID=A0ABU4Y5P4_9HYPH|nr:hypothetical protein [Mesorhizobium sp. VK24D]MDX8481643.1 hypothetical protein [Mesorhizobium sp. VK24D]
MWKPSRSRSRSASPLLNRHVDADHGAARPDLEGGNERIHAGSAAEIDDGLARLRVGKMEVVADPGERFDRLGRNAVEIGGWIADALSQRPPHLERFSATLRYIALTLVSSSLGSNATDVVTAASIDVIGIVRPPDQS